MSFVTLIFLCLIGFMIMIAMMSIVVVPQKQAYIVEHLGKYRITLEAGLHVLTPFLDNISYRLS